MESSKKIRTFIALKPPEHWIDALAKVADELKNDLRSKEIKWVQPEQIHITLCFLGYIRLDQIPTVIEALNKVGSASAMFTLRGGPLGCFPSVRRARVLWLGVEDRQDSAAELQKRIMRETSGLGEPPEDRDFTPHLTLARIGRLERSEAAALERLVEKSVTFSRDWKISEVLLMQSHLSSSGARYEVLHSAPLQAP